MVGVILVLASTQIDVTSSSASSYDHWKDLNEDGIIDVNDLQSLASAYGTSGDPINKTELLLDLQDRVEALENQTVPPRYISPPAYDSGWQPINKGQLLTFTHDLNTVELLVYVIGKSPDSTAIHQQYYGYAFLLSGQVRGLSWYALTETSIKVLRGPDDTIWSEVRVMLWIIQEPST